MKVSLEKKAAVNILKIILSNYRCVLHAREYGF